MYLQYLERKIRSILPGYRRGLVGLRVRSTKAFLAVNTRYGAIITFEGLRSRGPTKRVIDLQDVIQFKPMGNQRLGIDLARLHGPQQHWNGDRIHQTCCYVLL